VLDLNLKGVLLYSQTAAREMIRAGHGGKIVNMASMEGMHPWENLAHYTTSKAGVIMLTKAMALELARHGILINAVAPGGIMTPGTAVQGSELVAAGKSLEQVTAMFMARLALGRIGTPDDVAKVVVFLASGAADYMTGTVLLVDGGWQLG
jgi:2-deoxy-D-gluconate 3-dehydrogenase